MNQSDPDHDPRRHAKDALARRLALPRKGDLYQHYKGGLCRIVSVSIVENLMIGLVTYSSLSYPHEIDTTRLLEDFLETLEVDGESVLRFERRIEVDSPPKSRYQASP